jgi:hypothetical protein
VTEERCEPSAKRLTSQEKLQLVLSSYQAGNIVEYCRDNNIDRSYLYQLRRELEGSAVTGWEKRHPGRPSKADEVDGEAMKAELEQTRQQLAEARDEATKWEVRAELQGFYLQAAEGALKKKEGLPNRAARRRARRENG